MSDNAPVSPDDQSTPEQCLSKLTALIKYSTMHYNSVHY